MRDPSAIQIEADRTREEHWPSGEIPIDIDLILERMGIDIVPTANLRREVGIDACISADLTCIYVDLEYAMDERMNFRVRFSHAHELGHVKLHQHVFDAFRKENPKSVLAWAELIRARFETNLLEREANEFAGCFLVPNAALQQLYDSLYSVVHEKFVVAGMDPAVLDPEILYAYMANDIHEHFEVSATVIEIRLRKNRVTLSRSS